MNNLTEKQLRQNAIKRVKFKQHFSIYVVVIALLWIIWAISGNQYMWPVWPTGGWGIAIFFHYNGFFNSFGLFSVEKEFEKFKKERDKQ